MASKVLTSVLSVVSTRGVNRTGNWVYPVSGPEIHPTKAFMQGASVFIATLRPTDATFRRNAQLHTKCSSDRQFKHLSVSITAYLFDLGVSVVNFSHSARNALDLQKQIGGGLFNLSYSPRGTSGAGDQKWTRGQLKYDVL